MNLRGKQVIAGVIIFSLIIGGILFAFHYFGIFLSILKWIGYILLGIVGVVGIIVVIWWVFDKLLKFFEWIGSWII